MAKLKDLATGRNQGLLMAHKIVQKGGIEALEKEIRYRNIMGISINVTKKELNEATRVMKEHATQVAIVLAMVALLEEFSFSKLQIQKFKKAFDDKVNNILSDEATIKEYIELVSDKYDIDITFE